MLLVLSFIVPFVPHRERRDCRDVLAFILLGRASIHVIVIVIVIVVVIACDL